MIVGMRRGRVAIIVIVVVIVVVIVIVVVVVVIIRIAGGCICGGVGWRRGIGRRRSP